jgi:hypothetical protein
MTKTSRTSCLAAALLAACALGTSAAHADTAVGLRGGLSIDPDQVLIGVHLQPPAVAENLYVVPSAEAGLGDDAFTISINGDLQYQFGRSGGVRPYAGGGLTLYYFNLDNGGDDTDFGLNAVGGLLFDRSKGHPIFLEGKLGLTDRVPDWKFMVGLMFR